MFSVMVDNHLPGISGVTLRLNRLIGCKAFTEDDPDREWKVDGVCEVRTSKTSSVRPFIKIRIVSKVKQNVQMIPVRREIAIRKDHILSTEFFPSKSLSISFVDEFDMTIAVTFVYSNSNKVKSGIIPKIGGLF